MQINDLKPKQGNVNIEAEVIEKEEPREFEKFDKKGKVCNAKIKDESGTIKLTLWNEEIDLVKVGDKIKIHNGYVTEWNNEKQISVGKFGTLIVENEDEKIEKELTELEKQDEEIEKLSILEKSLENKNEINDVDLEKEKKELDELEKKSDSNTLDQIEDEIKNLDDDAISLDEIDEFKKEDEIKKKEEYDNNEDLDKDFIEEEVIDDK